MGIILLAALILIEGFFLVRALQSKDMRTKEKSIARLGTLAVFVLLTAVGLFQWSFRYYGVTAVLVIQSIFAILALRSGKQKAYSIGRAVSTFISRVLVFALAAFPAIFFPQFTPISPTGNLTVNTAEFVWTDEAREETFTEAADNRFVNVLFCYPQEQGQYPLVIFSHGSFGFNGTNRSTYEDLASNGYIVASVGHPYHAFYTTAPEGNMVIADANFINGVYEVNNMEEGPEQQAMVDSWLDLRVQDMNFTLDTIIAQQKNNPTDALFGKIDLDKIGLFGHSLGGAASVELGRLRDDIDAVIDLDGSMLGETLGYENGKMVYNETPYPVPLLDVFAQDHYEAALLLGDEYMNLHTDARAKEAYQAVLKNAGHMNFTDLPMFSPALAKLAGSGVSLSGAGTINAREGIETMNGWVLDFFNYTLKDGTRPVFD